MIRKNSSILDLCADVPCKNGGTCSLKSASTYTCLCPPRFSGNWCEKHKNNPKVYKKVRVYLSQGFLWHITKPHYRIISVNLTSNTESWNTVPVNHVHFFSPPLDFHYMSKINSTRRKHQALQRWSL